MSEKKKSDLIPRVITAVAAVPIIIFIIFVAPAWVFGALIATVAAISAWEYANIVYGKKHKNGTWLTAILAFLVSVSMYRQTPKDGEFSIDFLLTDAWALATLCLAVLILFLYFLFSYKDQKDASQLISGSVTALLYGSVMITTLALVHRNAGSAGAFWILLTLLIVWVSDTGAYFTGRAFGKTKLYQAVSPNKSIEGAIGGFVLSLAAAIGANSLFPSLAGNHEFLGFAYSLSWNELSLGAILLIAIPANLLGQTGDLAESLIKRAHGVKDSGTIVYGHGGMLDRIDALIFAAPWVYICQRIFL